MHQPYQQEQNHSKHDASEQHLAKRLQINSAQEQRVANRDYHEKIVNHFNDAKTYMLSLPEDKLDQKSIESGRHFSYRFGRDFNPNIRQKVITLKRRYSWTEREVKQLLITGGIRVNRQTEEVRYYRDFHTYVFGWLVIVLMSTYYMLMIFSMSSAMHGVVWKQMLGQLTAAGLCTGTLWLFNWMLISPYKLLQRTTSVN